MNILVHQTDSEEPQSGTFSPTGQSAGIEFNDMVRILTERRAIILSMAGLGLILGIIVSLLMTPLYRADAMVELNSPASEVINEASGNARPVTPNGQEMLATQLGLLRSDSLARRVVQDLNLLSKPGFSLDEGTRQQKLDHAVKALQANSLVTDVRSSLLIRVSYSSADPVLAARVANALVDGFIASGLERRYDSSSYARDFLREQLATTKTALENSERQLNDYAIGSGIFRAPAQVSNGVTVEGASLAANNLTALNQSLNEARIKRIGADQAYRNGTGTRAASQSIGLSGLRQQRATLQAERAEKAKLFKDDYPAIVSLTSQIGALDRAISSETAAASGGLSADLLAEYRAAQRTEDQLAVQVNALKGQVQQERGRSIEYNILQREVDTNRALYDALLQRYKEIGVTGGIGQSNISLVDRAEPPQTPYRPNLPLNVGLGLVAGVGLGVLLAVAAHFLFDNIVNPVDVRTRLKLPVLGVIPKQEGDETLFESLEDRRSEVSEAYYSLRTTLRFTEGGMPKSLLVTSSRPGEGKSTSAYAIASAFARGGMKVLLIDADLRKPTFVSKQEKGRGLAWLLASEDPLLKYVEQTATTGLNLLPVGRFSGSPAELLGSSRLPFVVEEATHNFDLVILDGPPVLGLADAPLLGALAERTIVVVESREARTGAVTEMVRRLQSSGSRVLGVILTKVRRDGGASGYNYYSYSYGNDGVGGKVSSNADRSLDLGSGDTAL